MAENDFDKTVKLSSGSTPTVPPPSLDKTIKLTPQDDKTVKLTSVPPISPTAPPVPSQTTAQPVPLPPQVLAPPTTKAGSGTRIIIIAGSILVIALGSSWYFLPPWLKKKAGKLSQQEKHSEAAQNLKMALVFFPLNGNPYLVSLGREQRLSKDFSGSQKSLEKVLSKNPEHFEALRELGFTFKDLGQSQKALETLQKCVQINANDHEALKWVARLSYDLKDYNVSTQAYEQLSKTSEIDAQDWYQLGRAYFELGKMDESAGALANASKMNKDLKGVHGLLAKIDAAQGKFAEAVGENKVELSMSPNDAGLQEALAESAWQAGTNALAGKNRDAAASFFEEGLAVPSKQAGNFHFELSKIFWAKHKKKESLGHLKEAVQSDPSFKIKARRDPAFASLRKSAEFQKAVR